MTLQTILYFISILLTCALTGFLTFYAWKHRQVPTSSAYARLTLSECFFALAEIFSVLSPSSTAALFWFQMRYLAGAFMGVFWFVFALEYSGRKAWLSKRLLAGLFVIPFVTQVLLWSNRLHGLWAQQEVGFFRSGPLWMADVAARIPGMGYLMHSFYTLLLTLAGIALMFLTAWKLRREFLGQALMITGAGLTAFTFAMNSLFNFLPKTEFNPFTPGIGLSVLLIALAVFRFQFLKRAPAQKSAARSISMDGQEVRSLAVFILIFILFASGIGAIGYVSYQRYEGQFRAEVDSQLSAIAALKVSGLENWRAERMADAETLYNNPTFALLVQMSLENPADTQAGTQLQAWMDTIYNFYHYDRIFLLDTGGIERFSSPATPEPVAAHLTQEAAAVIHSGQVTLLDFHRDSPDGKIYLALLVPIYAEGAPGRPLGLLVLRIDPNIYLYPYLNQWPGPSTTAETLLIRRDGNDALFLNELKFEQNTALNLRIPLEDTQVLSVKAALGQTGIVEGIDYRGQPVIGYVCGVPGSPWFLVSRMDSAEVYAPLRERLWQIILFFGVLILAAGAGLVLVWRQQRLRYYRAQVEAMDALHASEEKFRLAFDTSPDSVAITRLADGMFVSVNKGFEQISGYSRDETIGKTSAEINIWKNPEDRRKVVEELRARGGVRNYEAPFLTRYGEIYGLMSAAIIELNGAPHILNITRDITERKQAEEKLVASEVRYRRLFETARDGILILDAETGVVVDVNPFLVEMLGYTREEICGKELWELGFFKDIAMNKTNFLELQQKEYIRYENLPLETADGLRFYVEFVSNVYQVDHHKIIQCNIRDITERKQVEEALRESEDKFKYVFDHSVIGKSITLPTGEININCAFSNMLGYSQEELKGSKWQEITHPDDTELTQKVISSLLSGEKESARFIKRYLHKNGSVVWTDVSTSLRRDRDGKPLYFMTSVSDITERKRAEEELRKSEAQYRLLAENMSDTVWLMDMNLKTVYISPSVVRLRGFTLEEINSIPLDQQMTPESLQRAMMLFAEALSPGNLSQPNPRIAYSIELEFYRKDGSSFWSENTFTLILDSNGQSVNILGSGRDITERKQAKEKLAWEQYLLSAMLDNLPDHIYFKDRHSRFTRISKSLAEMFGSRNSAEMLGKTDFDFFTEEHARRAFEAEQNIMTTGQPVISLEEKETWPDGRVTWVNTTKMPLLDQAGNIIGTFGSSRDITERKRAEGILREYNTRLEAEVEARTRQLREAQEQLVRQERLAVLGQLAGSVGHELRNPLGVISNAIYFLKMAQPNADDRVKEYLNIIANETRTSDKIVTDLLDFTRIKSVDREPASVSKLVAETLERYPVPPSVKVAIEIPADLPLIFADPHHVVQILGNLIVNACQAMASHAGMISTDSAGTPDIGKLTLSAMAQGDMIIIEVRDTGVGIPPENMSKIFEPLFTTKTKGIGLGLAVSKKLAEANGGRIEVQSEPGAGSTFTLVLPVYDVVPGSARDKEST